MALFGGPREGLSRVLCEWLAGGSDDPPYRVTWDSLVVTAAGSHGWCLEFSCGRVPGRLHGGVWGTCVGARRSHGASPSGRRQAAGEIRLARAGQGPPPTYILLSINMVVTQAASNFPDRDVYMTSCLHDNVHFCVPPVALGAGGGAQRNRQGPTFFPQPPRGTLAVLTSAQRVPLRPFSGPPPPGPRLRALPGS